MAALDLRTERDGALPIGFRALSKQSEGYTMPSLTGDKLHWWDWYTTIKGYNGAGGYWVEDEVCWNSGACHHRDIRTLSWDESRQLEADIERLKTDNLHLKPQK